MHLQHMGSSEGKLWTNYETMSNVSVSVSNINFFYHYLPMTFVSQHVCVLNMELKSDGN